MKQFRQLVGKACFLLLVALNTASLRAQVNEKEANGVPQLSDNEIGRLQAALKRLSPNPVEADSLLTQARRLNYQPGQVVALCQLAAIRFQQQQPDQANALLQEAGQLAAQIRGIDEVGWAMNQLPNIARKIGRRNPEFAVASQPVLQALGKSMAASGALLAESMKGRPKGPRPRPSADEPDFRPDIPAPGAEANPYRHQRPRPDYLDRWVDTLINSATTSPRVVQQLTTHKKIRDSSQALSDAFAKKGNYAKAYQYFLQYTAYKDSLNAEATTRRLALLQYQQNLLKKEAQINLLTKDRLLSEQESQAQRQYVLLMIGLVVLLGALLVVLSRNNRAKHRANQRLNEQKETLQQTLKELKTTQNQLIHAEKMASLGELTAGIAHEIQNPLNFVNNFAEVSAELMTELVDHRQQPTRDPDLEDELLTDVLQNLQIIHQHGNRASAIVRGMLEHARTSSGQKEPIDLNALTDEYARLAYQGMRAKNKEGDDAMLTTTFDPGVGLISVIPQDMGRVLLNIFNNAFYAVQQRQKQGEPGYKAEVRVSTKRDANEVIITIRDNGTGIPEEVKKKMFQPFFTTKPSGEGTGLGLSLSYDIITKGHGGKLAVESEEGKFTEIIVTLPVGV